MCNSRAPAGRAFPNTHTPQAIGKREGSGCRPRVNDHRHALTHARGPADTVRCQRGSQGVQHTTRAVIAQGPAAAVACPGRPAPHVLLAGGVPPKHTEGIETRTPWSPSCSHQACGASQRARWWSTGNSLARGKPQRPRARDQRTAHARGGGALHRATPVATAEWDGAVAPLSSVRHE